jgi:uncharacterized membrane protein YedE/YeeE
MSTLPGSPPAAAHPRAPAPYANPYVAGVGLGLVLLAAYVLMGRGLGASAAPSTLVAWFMDLVAPAHTQANEFYQGYLEGGVGHPLKSWIMFEVLGVMVGGFLSGILAGRLARTVEKGPRISAGARLGLAFAGGALMGFGSKLARGCTSGQALTGGAVLNLGSWVFMMMVFAGAYALAWAMRRQWR